MPAPMGGPSTSAAQAMALVVAHVTRELVLNFWPIKQPNTSSQARSRATEPLSSAPRSRVATAVVLVPSTALRRRQPDAAVLCCALRSASPAGRRPRPALLRLDLLRPAQRLSGAACSAVSGAPVPGGQQPGLARPHLAPQHLHGLARPRPQRPNKSSRAAASRSTKHPLLCPDLLGPPLPPAGLHIRGQKIGNPEMHLSRDELIGSAFIAFGITLFVCFFYVAIVSKLLPPYENQFLAAIQEDWYYCLLVPLTLPVIIVAVYLHWLSMKMFKHA